MRFLYRKKFMLHAIGTLLVVMMFGSLYDYVAKASVQTFYATSCLGGWGNTHLATGEPDAKDIDDKSFFTSANSAELDTKKHAQIYCGGFNADGVKDTVPQKINVKFSWAVIYPVEHQQNNVPDDQALTSTSTEALEPGDTTATTSALDLSEQQNSPVEGKDFQEQMQPSLEEDQTHDTQTTTRSDSLDQQEASPEIAPPSTPETTSVQEEAVSLYGEKSKPLSMQSILGLFASIAYAQEDTTQDNLSQMDSSIKNNGEESLASSSPEIVATTTEERSSDTYGLVEVLYTLNGSDWKTLGFVEENEFSNKYFEIPIEEVSNWGDISKIQIGVQSVPVIDGIAPVIYLDAVLLEIEERKPWEDPYTPPEGLEGDVVMKKETKGDISAVLVSRKSEFIIGDPKIELWVSVASTQDSMIGTVSEDEATSIEPILQKDLATTSTATSTEEDERGTRLSSTTSLSPIEETALVEVMQDEKKEEKEIPLSLEKITEKQWRFIADQATIAKDSPLWIEEKNIFWLGKDRGSIWRFNIQSNAYESVSLNVNEGASFYFRNEAGDMRSFTVDPGGMVRIFTVE